MATQLDPRQLVNLVNIADVKGSYRFLEQEFFYGCRNSIFSLDLYICRMSL